MKLKISRLFHWLYATLMFLPILMFIPSCLYYSLNKYATNTEITTINYKYQSNEVNSLDDLVEGNIYQSDFNFTQTNLNEDYFHIGILKYSTLECSLSFMQLDESIWQTEDFDANTNNAMTIDMHISDSTLYINFGNDENYSYNIYDWENKTFECLDCVFIYYSDCTYLQHNTPLPQYTDYNVIESVDTNVQDTISNKMYQAWEGVWNLPLFQWTKNSFITAPFSYITGLFGLSSDNSLNCVFTYFASISICWLVFDLIMYVPNLAHRWLDRSAIE